MPRFSRVVVTQKLGSRRSGVASKIKHADMSFNAVGEFLAVANFLEWWLIPTTVGTSLQVYKIFVPLHLFECLLVSAFINNNL